MSDSMIGTTVAGYRIEELIGRGGMSRVYRAEHLRLGRRDALKVLAPELLADESFRDRFEREWRVAAGIEHPNIIPVYDAGEANGHFYIAMRYVETTDLRALLERSGSLPPDRVVHIVKQTASALDAAHRRGLVHRDIKPGNILVADDDHVYLSDFGLAKHTTADRGLTRTGYFLGTVGYAAPEQIHGRALDARTDVYGLACLTYECLTAAWPYERDSDAEVMQAHLEAPPPRLSAALPGVPEALDEVISKGLAKAKEDRYPSCGAFASALEAALPAGTPVGAPAAPDTVLAGPPAAVPWPRRLGAGRWWLVGAAGLVVAGVATLGLFLALGDGSGKETQTTRPSPTTRAAIFSDDFGDPGGGWYEYESDAVRLGYQAGAYEIRVKVPNRRAYADTGFSPAASALGDVSVAVDARPSGSASSAFGLLCRIAGGSTFYGLLVGSRGIARIVKVVSGTSTVLRSARMDLRDVPTGQGRLRATCTGGTGGAAVTLTLAVDERRVLRTRDASRPLAAGAAGLIVESFDSRGVQVAFDNFAVRRARP